MMHRNRVQTRTDRILQNATNVIRQRREKESNTDSGISPLSTKENRISVRRSTRRPVVSRRLLFDQVCSHPVRYVIL